MIQKLVAMGTAVLLPEQLHSKWGNVFKAFSPTTHSTLTSGDLWLHVALTQTTCGIRGLPKHTCYFMYSCFKSLM